MHLPLLLTVFVGVSALDVMSFNIRYGTAKDGENAWPNRRELVYDVIRKHDPDVLGLQEALRFQLDEIGKTLPAYTELGVGRADGKTAGEYAAILYRTERFRVEEQDTFWFSDTPEEPGSKSWGNRVTRIATWARLVEKESEQSVLVYNVHLDHESQPSREKSVDLLLERITEERREGEQVIVMGDFNADEDNAAITAMKKEFVDSYRVAHPDEKEVGTFSGFEGRRRGRKIDYVFVLPDANVVGAAIIRDREDDRDPSDHYPVTASLRLSSPPRKESARPGPRRSRSDRR
jgi:endonuclease/exonuclease/phosphatase family metal-dependent hydrolase